MEKTHFFQCNLFATGVNVLASHSSMIDYTIIWKQSQIKGRLFKYFGQLEIPESDDLTGGRRLSPKFLIVV